MADDKADDLQTLYASLTEPERAAINAVLLKLDGCDEAARTVCGSPAAMKYIVAFFGLKHDHKGN